MVEEGVRRGGEMKKNCRLCRSKFEDDSLDSRHDDCPSCEQEQWDQMVQDLRDQGLADKSGEDLRGFDETASKIK